MSWNVRLPNPVRERDLHEQADAAWAMATGEKPRPDGGVFVGSVPDSQKEPAKAAFDQGVQAARAIHSGALGGEDDLYSVSFSGHAVDGQSFPHASIYVSIEHAAVPYTAGEPA